MMWIRYLIFECPEKHVIINDKNIKVVSML